MSPECLYLLYLGRYLPLEDERGEETILAVQLVKQWSLAVTTYVIQQQRTTAQIGTGSFSLEVEEGHQNRRKNNL